MDRVERIGVGLAVVGHVALFGLLSTGFLATPNPLVLKSTPVEVSLIDEVALESTAPVPQSEAPAPKLAEVEGPAEDAAPSEPTPAAPEPAPTRPEPVAAPAPPRPKAVAAPAPKPVAKPKPAPPKPAAAKPVAKPAAEPKAEARREAAASAPKQVAAAQAPRATRPTGRLDGITRGLSDRPTESRATTAPATAAGPAVQASLRAEVLRQLKPHWSSPTGADVEQLRTIIEVRLARDGSIAGTPRLLQQTGVNDSNRSQASLHAERALKAVQLAAPFKLPPEYYDAWKVIKPAFDKRL